MVERFSMVRCITAADSGLESDPNGPYVLFRDYQALEAQRRHDDDADTECRRLLCEERDQAERQRDAFRAEVENLLKSAYPHPTDHPTMFAAWRRAEALLAKM